MALREIEARNAAPRERVYKLWDGEGLSLYVHPNGRKYWRMRYCFRGKDSILSFGPYPQVGIAAAREMKDAARKALLDGRNPKKARASANYDPNSLFREIAASWHRNRIGSIDPAHATRIWARLERDVMPELGDSMMHEITPPDVLQIVRRIEERGSLDVSRRAKQTIGQIFQFAIASGICNSDPTAHLRGALKPRPRVQHMAKVSLGQLPQLVRQIADYGDAGDRRSQITKHALSFALLTWVRTKELRFATKWEFEGLDGDAPLWRISADRMKMRREHIVPLSRQAAEIVRAQMGTTQSDFLFPGRKNGQPLSSNTMIYGLYRMGYHGRQTVHGFRGLASTWANEQLVEVGKPPIWLRKFHTDWVESQLAHSEENQVRGAYNAAEYLVPRRIMLQEWADFLDRCGGA